MNINKVRNIVKTPEGYIVSDKELINLIIPVLIGFILDFFVSFIDSIMVSSIGEAAFSGVSLIDQFIYFLLLFFSAFSAGGAIVIGQYLGNNQEDSAKETCTQLIWFTTIIAIVLMIILIFLRKYIIGGLFGHVEADVWDSANKYGGVRFSTDFSNINA